MKSLQVALYARVSSEQQAEAKTIESQLAEMRTRMVTDGFELAHILEFIDEGYSGSTLVRPSLERLRDVVAAGGFTPEGYNIFLRAIVFLAQMQYTFLGDSTCYFFVKSILIAPKGRHRHMTMVFTTGNAVNCGCAARVS